MEHPSIKRRMIRAKKKAEKNLSIMGYSVIISNNDNACLVGFRSVDVRIIRIALDEITPIDRKSLSKIESPQPCAKEIWFRKQGSSEFEIVKI
jgi:hypothetical protein